MSITVRFSLGAANTGLVIGNLTIVARTDADAAMDQTGATLTESTIPGRYSLVLPLPTVGGHVRVEKNGSAGVWWEGEVEADSQSQSGDAFARLGAPAGASHAADIADIPTVAEFNARTVPTTGDLGAEFTAAALARGPGGGTGSGLTAQETRDAMMLAPTAGAPAAGSVDAHLDLVALESSVLGQFGVTWGLTYPLTRRDGVINVPRGDAYTISTTLGASFPLTGRTVYFTAQKTKAATNTTAIVNRAMTITSEANRTCTITLTAAETATADRYHYEIEARDTGTEANPSTAETGTLNIVEDLRK